MIHFFLHGLGYRIRSNVTIVAETGCLLGYAGISVVPNLRVMRVNLVVFKIS